MRARIHYFDVTAEQGSALSTFEMFDSPARERRVCIIPAAGFYGTLGDLLATDIMTGWAQADRIDVAIALDSWLPTRGTRTTGARNTARRLVLSDGALQPIQPSAPVQWTFSEPFGMQEVVELPFTETILKARHLRVRDIGNYLNQTPLRQVRDPATPEPVAADDSGRSSQRFLIDVIVGNGDKRRRITAQGRDIYAVTAPIVVEAAERQLVDASNFVQTLERNGELTLARSYLP